MKILEKYLFFSILKASFATLLTLAVIFLFFKFLEDLSDIGNANYTTRASLRYLALSTPFVINSLTILGLMIGVIFSIGGLNSNKELQIYQVATISLKQLINRILIIGFLLCIIFLGVSESIFPITQKIAENYKSKLLGKNNTTLNSSFWFRQDNKFLYIKKSKQSIDFDSIHVFEINDDSSLSSFSKNNSVSFDGKLLELSNTKETRFDYSNDYSLSEEEITTDLTFSFDNNFINNSKESLKTLSLRELLELVVHSIKNEITATKYLIELVTRLVRPFTLIAMILVAIPFILNFDRSSSIGNRIFLGIVIGVLTHLLTKISTIISLKFQFINFFGPLIPTFILIIIGLILIKTKVINN